jgi:hypothetical protein
MHVNGLRRIIVENIKSFFPNPRRRAALRELEESRKRTEQLSRDVADGLRSGDITDCGR